MATPLYIAVNNQHVDAVATLLNSGADPNIMTKGNRTPLLQAIWHNNVQLVELLLYKNADPNLGFRYGQWYVSPIYSTVYGNCVDGMRLLIRAGANINNMEELLLRARAYGHIEMEAYLSQLDN